MPEYHHKPRKISQAIHAQRIVLLVAAYAIRAFSLDSQGLWRDEVDQWRFALQPWAEQWTRFTQPGWNGPLFSPLLKIWIACTGDSVYAMRYFSLLCGVLSITLVYVLSRRLVGQKVAIVTAALMSFSPYMVWYGQEIKMYTWVTMLVLLALYALDKAGTSKHLHWWIVMLVAMLVLFYSHVLGPLLALVLGFWFLLRFGGNRRVWIGMLLALLLLILLARPLIRWQVEMLLQVRETGFPSYSFLEMILILLNGWSTGVYAGGWFRGQLALIAVIIFGLLAIIGAGVLLLKWRIRRLSMLLIWLCLPGITLWVVSLRGSILTDRYLIWSAPAFYVLVSTGIFALCKIERWLAPLLLILVLMLNNMCIYSQATYPIKPEFPNAIAYLRTHRQPEDLLLFQIPYNHLVVLYYDETLLNPWAEAPYTNWPGDNGEFAKNEGYVDGEMRRITQDYTNIWLVYSEATQWDSRELVKAWLDRQSVILDTRHFQGVSLYHYQVQKE